MSTQQRTNRGERSPRSSSTPYYKKYDSDNHPPLIEDPRPQDPETKGVSRRVVIGVAALVFGAVAGLAAMQSKDNHDQHSSAAEHQPTPEEQATRLVDAYSDYLSQRQAYEAGQVTQEPQPPVELSNITTRPVEAGDSIGTVVDRHIATLAEADAFHTKPEQDGVTNATSARVAELHLTDGNTRYELQPGDTVTLAQYQGFVIPLTINSHEPSSGVPQHTLEP